MPAVIRHDQDIIVVDAARIETVKASALEAPLRRARLNLHRSEDDQIQEMLIAFCRDSLNPVHRHLTKTESIHAIEGRALICFFDEVGNVTRRLTIGAPGTNLPQLYRLAAPIWHTVVPLDEMLVVHEVTTGPFRREQDILPSWVPQTQNDLRLFVDRLTNQYSEV